MGQSISMPLSCGGTAVRIEPTDRVLVEDIALQNESVCRLRTAERFATGTHDTGPIRRDQKPSIATAVASEPGSDVLLQPHGRTSTFGGKHSHPHPMATTQERQHAASLEDPPAFWDRQARSLGIKWDTLWDPAKVLEVSPEFPSGRWFSGGQLNTCFNVSWFDWYSAADCVCRVYNQGMFQQALRTVFAACTIKACFVET